MLRGGHLTAISRLAVSIAVAAWLAGCESAAMRERRQAVALADSVCALPEVRRYAPVVVRQTRAAIARGDSLLDGGAERAAQEGFAEAVALSRLALVLVEEVQASAPDSSALIEPMSPDST